MLPLRLSRAFFALPCLILGPVISAQQEPPPDTIYFETKIGSFKLLNCRGELKFSFEGTVLIADLEGSITPEGALKKEYEHNNPKRIAYFGKGSLRLTGKWRAVQWFGKDMNGSFEGHGIIRVVGEFDKNLDTGHYWYKSNPVKEIWYSTLTEHPIPPPDIITKQNNPVNKTPVNKTPVKQTPPVPKAGTPKTTPPIKKGGGR